WRGCCIRMPLARLLCPMDRRFGPVHRLSNGVWRGYCQRCVGSTWPELVGLWPRRRPMGGVMPEPDRSILDRRETIAKVLRGIVPGVGVIAAERAMRPYETDGLTAYRQLPMIVVLPETTAQVSRILKYCHAEGIKVVPRGAGTSLSGGALPLADGVLLGMAKFN